jgi:hypothetical protein
MERVDFVRADVFGSPEYQAVVAIADALFEHLESPAAAALILEANQPGRSSADVQNGYGDHSRGRARQDDHQQHGPLGFSGNAISAFTRTS